MNQMHGTAKEVDRVVDMTNEQVWSRIARTHLRQGRIQEAQTLVNAWAERAERLAEPKALRALLALSRDRLDEARSLATQAAALDERCALAYFVLAQTHLARGQAQEALICLQRATALQPGDAEFTCLRAQLLLDNGESRQAEAMLRQALDEGVRDGTIQLMLAEILFHQQEVDPAEIEALVRAGCEAVPEMAAGWALHARVLAQAGDLEAARQRLDLALGLRPDFTPFLLQLAQLRLGQGANDGGQLKEVEALVRRAAVLGPTDWRAPLLLSQVQCQQGAWAAGLRTLAEAGRDIPRQPQLLLQLARVCALLGQFQAAREALEQGTAAGAGSADLRAVRLDLSLREGDFVGASRLFDELDATPTSARRVPLPLTHDVVKGQCIGLVPQDIGQCFLYVRYARALGDLGARVRVVAPEPLQRFLSRTPGIEPPDAAAPWSATYLEPMQRLPLLLGAPDTGPTNEAYLRPSSEAVDRTRQLRDAHAGPCLVIDLPEDMKLPWLAELGSWLVQQRVLVVLLAGTQAAWLPPQAHCRHLPPDDLESLAAWIQVADAVVTQDRPLAHLAGGMHAAGLVMLALDHDPVFGSGSSRSPLYPTLQLYRETVSEGWQTTADSLLGLLAPLVQQRESAPPAEMATP
ncbi:tetratricopeptide repeat protein [Variovorax saccharolyticus]|uniref:tetratricopeptide repeat protein n=1 Tax=Variovorax saccharolyticus TaxID=3053516 RepID=UPI002574F7F6|nr:tetratricopeptide repeat protein [Variovorax sp. J31P216]MDM0029786.1 tetratricopeptide repeat protein [Variovorax sp. J31P216]